MIRLAVFGQPVAQSLSPRIHRAFARQFGLDIDYRAIEATPESFSRQLGELARAGGRGCNITAPFKYAAWRAATTASDHANRAEAANTLVFSASEWFADNTDGGGLVNDLQNNAGISLQGKKLCLVGAGGAACGVLAALLNTSPGQVTIANRTASKACALADRHADLGNVTATGLDTVAGHGPFDLFINATSQGHGGGAPQLHDSWLAADGLCYDMNYGKAAEPLGALCRKQGIPYRDGLGMLVGQAALSFALWTGQEPATAAVLEELRPAAGK